MNAQGLAFLGLTALVGALVALLAFTAMRFAAAARDTRRHLRDAGSETAILSAALQEAVTKLRTQERAMAARAEASERLSSEIVASLTSGLLVVGLDGRLRILNPAGRRLLGVSDPIPFTSYTDLLRESVPLADVVADCLATGQPIVRRAVQIRSRGRTLHLGVTASPLLDEESKLAGAVCLFTDLTAVAELEEQLRLKDTLARLGELTAGLAHEFRNGLATIHGYARLVKVDDLDAKNRQCVEGIRDETDALGRIVTNFLTFAKPAPLSLAPLDLHELVDRAADDIRGEVTGRGGAITLSGEFGTVEADDVLLRQAVSNVIRNAMQACERAGVVPQIRIDAHPDRDRKWIRLHVIDNGPGVDPSVRDRIFQPFFTTRRDGTGLGLALVQKIIVTHNGRVSVSNDASGGAVFEMILPLAR